MICFEIWINGIRKNLIGSDDAEEFGACLNANPLIDPPHISLDLSGYIANEKEYPHELRWGTLNIKSGDEVAIKIIESNTPDEPQLIRYNEGIIESEEQTQAMLCSNCGKSHFETDKWVRSSRITLCYECVKLMSEIMEKE